MIMVTLTGLFLFGVYSSVYACDRAKKAEVVRHSLDSTPPVVVKVQIPREATRRVICVSRDENAGRAHAMIRTAKAARTLGRAFVTTVGAVVGTLVQVAVEKTAAVV
jgi:hypothetical protein